MSLFSSPAPQWQDMGNIVAVGAFRLALVLDGDGFYRFYEGVIPTAYIEDDGTGMSFIVLSSVSPEKIAFQGGSGVTYVY